MPYTETTVCDFLDMPEEKYLKIEHGRNQFVRVAKTIHSEKLRNDMIFMIDCFLPDYFWLVPASSSGKYHPAYALGEGGLMRHTLAACAFCDDLAEAFHLSDRKRDLALCALLLHDGLKYGYEQGENTCFEHPLLMSDELRAIYRGDRDFRIIAKLIASHMGKWNTSKHSNKTLPVPHTPLQLFVHACDYLASRKHYTVELDSLPERTDSHA